MGISHCIAILIPTALCILTVGVVAERKFVSSDGCLCGLLEYDEWRKIPWTLQVKVRGKGADSNASSVGTVIGSNVVLASEKFLTYIADVPYEKKENHTSFDKTTNMTTVTTTSTTLYRKVPTLRRPDEIELTDTKQLQTYPVEGIYNWTGGAGSWATWMVVLKTSHDFALKNDPNSDNKLKGPQPVCFPTKEELSTVGTKAGRKVHFKRADGAEITDLTVKNEQDCGSDGLPTSEGKLYCVTPSSYYSGGVKMDEVGQPLFAEVVWNPHGTEDYGSFSYLVGITVAIKESGGTKHLYFSTVKSESISAVEKQATTISAKWCHHPWPWITAEKAKREESLPCECGIPNPGKPNTAVTEYEFPWMVKIRYFDPAPDKQNNYDYLPHCGGSIISDRVILTSALCLVQKAQILAAKRAYNVVEYKRVDVPPKPRVFVQTHWRKKDPQEMEVPYDYNKILVHPGFIDGRRITPWRNLEYDIALIILTNPLTFDAIGTKVAKLRPICLPKLGEKIKVVGMKAIVAGWGPNSSELTFPEVLRKQEFTIPSFSRCTKAFPPNNVLTLNKVFCGGVSDVTRHPPITGDLGGPVFVKDSKGRYTQVGLVGYSLTRSSDDFQGTLSAAFYQNLQAMLSWVDYQSGLLDQKPQYCQK